MKLRLMFFSWCFVLVACSGAPSIPGDATWMRCSDESDDESCVVGETGLAGCEWVCHDGGCSDFLNLATEIDPAFSNTHSCPDMCDNLKMAMPFVQMFAWNPGEGTCSFYLTTFQPMGMDLMSVVPALREGDGTYSRQCIADAARNPGSLLFSFVIEGTEVPGDEVEHDRSVKPGDYIKKTGGMRRGILELPSEDGPGTVSEQDFDVTMDCIETCSSDDIFDYQGCEGQQMPSRSPERLAYATNFPDGTIRPGFNDGSAMSVALLVDQSGSMKGMVEQETGFEVTPDAGYVFGSEWVRNATDPNGFRLIAVRQLVAMLNSRDQAAVFKFSEDVAGDGARVVCGAEGLSEEAARQSCFGTDRDNIFESRAFQELVAEARGRSPLWAAVRDVYSFMKQNADTTVRHVVVITDGPDTCAAESPDFQENLSVMKSEGVYKTVTQPVCSTVGYSDFLDILASDVISADGSPKPVGDVPVHVSFIQLQSKGYPYIDPLQQEVACLTGGHYIFINALQMPHSEYAEDWGYPLEVAVRRAVGLIRYSMAGVWQAAVDVPDLNNGLLQPAAEIAVRGSIRVISTDESLLPELQAEFGVGYQDHPVQMPYLDNRGFFRVPGTSAETDCSWVPLEDEECMSASVSGLTGVCHVTNEEFGASCTDGTCINGQCVAAD